MDTGDLALPLTPPQSPYSFWRRIIALNFDIIFLELIVALVGVALFPLWVPLNAWGRLIGWGMALLYFGIFNSRYGNGQTLGKRIAGLQVVDCHGRTISLKRSLVRSLLLTLIIYAFTSKELIGFIQALFWHRDETTSPFLFIAKFVGAIVQYVTIYLFIFNRKTRQTLHDWMADTYVIHASSFNRSYTLPSLWKGHLWIGLILGIAIALAAPLPYQALVNTEQSIPSLLPIYQTLQNSNRFNVVQVLPYSFRLNDALQNRTLEIIVSLRQKPEHPETMTTQILDIVHEYNNSVNAAPFDTLMIEMVYGFNLGLASAREHYQYGYCWSQGTWQLSDTWETSWVLDTPHVLQLSLDDQGTVQSIAIGGQNETEKLWAQYDRLAIRCPLPQ